MSEQPTRWMLRGDAIVLAQDEQQLKIVAENGSHDTKGKTNELALDLKILSEDELQADLDREPEAALLRQLDAAGLPLSTPPNGSTPIQALNGSWGETVTPGRGIQRRLCNSSVVIVGCGGTGCLIEQSLASAGVCSFTLIDFDRVSPSNLNRQFAFCAEDIDEYKDEILARRLSQNQQVLESDAIATLIESAGQLAEMAERVDLIICCADEPPREIQILVARAAEISETAVLLGAVGVLHGAIAPLPKHAQEIRLYLQWISQIRQTCGPVLVFLHAFLRATYQRSDCQSYRNGGYAPFGRFRASQVAGQSIDFDLNKLVFTKMQRFASSGDTQKCLQKNLRAYFTR